MSDTVQEARNRVEMARTACEQSIGPQFTDEEYQLDVQEHRIALDALIAAVRAEERARLVALIASEECAHDLAHTVDDVNPRKTHTGDQEDAAIYCRHIAKYLAALTGADK